MKDQMKKGIGVVLACMLIVFWGGLTIDKCSAGIDTSMSVRKSEGTLLQYKAGKHVLGFSSEKMYVVGMGYALIEEFVGARAVVPESLGVGGDTSGKEGAADFRGVQYRDLWKAITVKYDPARDGLFESVYIINPGGEPKDIKLKYNTPVQVEQDGTLKFAHPSRKGYFTQSAPVAWQEIGGQKKRVKVGFKTHADHVIGFEVGDYDRTIPLVIDPVYQWHAFYGSGSEDYGYGIAVDTSGNVYVTGKSYVSWNGDGDTAPKHPHSGYIDMVVLKLDKEGLYQWHTFYGSKEFDEGLGIAVDISGNVYVTGQSVASWNGDGGTAPKHPHSGNFDMVVLKLDKEGLYQWHTFYGSYSDGQDIAVDGSGNVYVTGRSYVSWNGDGGTAPKHPHSGNYDMVVLKLDKKGLYQWHTFYGSSSDDYGYGIAVDISGNVYVSGGSYASWRGDSNTAPIHPYSGNYDMVVLKLASGDQDQYAVTVNASGTGSGAVSSTPAGIGFTYPAATSGNALFDSGSEIVLTATANAGSSASWSICPGIPAGDGTSVATCTISNLDEAISAAVTFSSQASGPDLTGYWKQMIVKKMGKKYLSIGHLVVQNSGDTDAGSFKVTFYLSEDGVTLGQVLKSTEVGSLKAGSETTLRFVYFSKNPLSGQYMIALIDSDDGVAEKDESNNRVVYQIP